MNANKVLRNLLITFGAVVEGEIGNGGAGGIGFDAFVVGYMTPLTL